MNIVSAIKRLFAQTFMVLLLLLILLAGNAAAQDSDNDGFTDPQEIAGITLLNGQILPRCPDNALATDACVDPAGADLFVILVAVGGARVPANPLSFMVNLTPSLGVHQIADNPDRLIVAGVAQKAIRLTLDPDLNDAIWGISLRQGTPLTAGDGTVFTARIRRTLDNKYTAATGSPAPQDVVDNCIRHTIAHEAGHNKSISPQSDSRFGGNHYATSDKVVMSQSATITSKGTRVTVVCPSNYASPDVIGFRLK